jgi:hypothetical protein
MLQCRFRRQAAGIRGAVVVVDVDVIVTGGGF